MIDVRLKPLELTNPNLQLKLEAIDERLQNFEV
jgi:hypothetical protein